MKAISLLLFLSLTFKSTLFAQGLDVVWQHSYGGPNEDRANSVIQTKDGGFAAAGYTTVAGGDVTAVNGLFDGWLIKTDAAGNLQWQKSYGGPGDDKIYSLQLTKDGGYIMAGYATKVGGDVTTLHSVDTSDYWLIKTDSIGNIEWQKSYGGTDQEQAYSVQQTKDGGYIVAGYSNSNNGDVSGHHAGSMSGYGQDYWVLKLSDTGAIQWQRSIGGSNIDIAYDVKQTKDGGFIVTGMSGSSDGDMKSRFHYLPEYGVVKLDSVGNLKWGKCYGGSYSEKATSVIQTFEGGYIISGSSTSSDGDVGKHYGSAAASDCWAIKLDDTGRIEWQQVLGGSDEDNFNQIEQTADSGFIAIGTTGSTDIDVKGAHKDDFGDNLSDMWVVRLNKQGSLKWQKCLGGKEREGGYSLQETADKGFILAGQSSSTDGDVIACHGVADFWLVKLMDNMGVQEMNRVTQEVSIFPNPAGSLLNVTISDNLIGKGVVLAVTDLAGKSIKSVIVEHARNRNQLDVSELEGGSYILTLQSQNEKASTLFVKEKAL